MTAMCHGLRASAIERAIIAPWIRRSRRSASIPRRPPGPAAAAARLAHVRLARPRRARRARADRALPQHHDDAHPHRRRDAHRPRARPARRPAAARFSMRRGFAVAIVAVGIIAVATLLVLVLGPRAVDEARKFSEQLPADRRPARGPPARRPLAARQRGRRRVQEWVSELPDQFTDERVAELASALVSGVVSVAMVVVLAIAVLVDGENLLARFRRLLPANRREQADAVGGIAYRTLGRYFGGSITVAVLMGLYVLDARPPARHPAGPARRALGDAHRPHPAGRRVPRRLLPGAARGHPGRDPGDHRRRRLRALHEPREPPHPAGHRRSLRRPDAAHDDGRGVRRRRHRGYPGALVATPFVGAAKAIYLEARGKGKPEEETGGGLVARLRKRFTRGG